MHRIRPLGRSLLAVLALAATAGAQATNQPRVTPGPSEPDWVAILEGMYGLDMFGDLLNPVESTPRPPRASSARRGTAP